MKLSLVQFYQSVQKTIYDFEFGSQASFGICCFYSKILCNFALNIKACVMNFRTIVDLPVVRWKLEPDVKIMCLGSCFAQEIGSRMNNSLPNGQVMINPNGVLYNPASISNALNGLLEDSCNVSDMVFLARDGFWHSWMHTNKFFGSDRMEFVTFLEDIREQAESTAQNEYRF